MRSAASTHTRWRRPRSVAPRPLGAGAAALLIVLALLLGGCGSSAGTGTGRDPAGAVPASAPLYLGATVRPEGSLKDAALAAGRNLTHQANPYVRLVSLLRTPGSPPLDFGRDIAPWLGAQAGIFVTAAGSAATGQLPAQLLGALAGSSTAGAFPFASGAQGAIVLDTTDAARARSFLNSQAAHAGAHATAYRGVSYQVNSGGVAFAMVDRFAVLGSESGVRGVIDTSAGGAALDHASGYAKLLSHAPAGTLAHLYSNGSGAGEALVQALTGRRELNLSLVPASDSWSLDADVNTASGAGGGLLAAGTNGAQALGELPAEAWLALGVGDAGATLGETVAGLQALSGLAGGAGESSAGLNVPELLEGLLRPLAVLGSNSAQAKRDYASWMGSGGVFASGGSLLEIKGAAVIASRDPALSHAAVGKLGAQLRRAGSSVQPVSIPGTDAAIAARVRGLPLTLDIANGVDSQGHTKFVLGLGMASVNAALHPPSTLAGAAATKAAADALGEGIQPSLIVNVPAIVSLLEGVGLTEGPAISGVLPYARNLTTIAGGTHGLGEGLERVRIVLGLRQSER